MILALPAALLAGCSGRGDALSLRTSGHIETTEVRVSTKVGGTLLSFPAKEGDRVERGRQIAQIDTVDLCLQRASAGADADLAASELRLREEGSRREEIAVSAALLTQAEAELAAAEADLSRMEGLLREGSGTVKARDDARTRRDLAAAGVEAARQQLKMRRDGSRPEEIAAARARLEAARARLALVEQQIRDASIQSPLDGIMTQKLVEEGELPAPGTPLCLVSDLAHPWLTVYVGETDLGRIRLGGEAEVRTDSGQTRTGRISFISEKAEFTPKNVQTRDERVKLVYKVKIALENEDGLFKSGMPAEASIPLGNAK